MRLRTAARSLSMLLFALLLVGSASAQTTGPFSLSNGYFQLAGNDGTITDLRFDATGSGAYGSNTVAASGHFSFLLDGALMGAPGAEWQTIGSTLRITSLPSGARLDITPASNTLMLVLTFSGSATVRHEWDLVFLSDGFYQRATGWNRSPDVAVDMPFESFYNAENGNFRCVEMFKRTAGPISSGDSRDVSWPVTRCRGRIGDDVQITATHALDQFDVTSDQLTLVHQGAGTSSAQIVLEVLPTSYATTLVGDRPIPEFFVEPAQSIASLYEPTVTHDADDLLTEFFHHMAFWWGTQGHSGGIWCDWGFIAGVFMDTPFRDSVAAALQGWIIGDDGYGNPDYAYTWGTELGWPFPAGRDTRHFNTNAIHITALWRYTMWTGDTDYLASGPTDRTVSIDYGPGGVVTGPAWTTPAMLTTGHTLGQTFTADAPFTRVGPLSPNWGTTGSGCTVTLYDAPGGNPIATNVFSNVPDNTIHYLSFSQLPPGQYYLEMSDPVGTIGWWSASTDALAGGDAHYDGAMTPDMLTRARNLMAYQQTVLLGDTANQIVTGANIGSTDHHGRNGDVGGNYYDILPFGYHDAMTDQQYYQSIRGMGELEQYLGNSTAAQGWLGRLSTIRDTFDTTYWRTGLDREGTASRYIGCVDVDGIDHDYGYTFVNTMSLTAGLAEGRPDRVTGIFSWLDDGESMHSASTLAKRVGIGFQDGTSSYNPATDAPNTPVQLTSVLTERFFAEKPFTQVASQNPTWATTDSGFTLSLLDGATGAVIASQVFTNAVDNAYNVMTFAVQPEGFYTLKMSDPVGTIGWWGGQWSKDIYGRWLATPRVTTLNNPDWWQAAVAGNVDDLSHPYHWDKQLQNGGGDIYESGFDVWARAQLYDADSAWERLQWILRRYADPDRLSGNAGFYGEAIQGGSVGAGSVGWVWSEFPESGILGASFLRGFLGPVASPTGLTLRPRVPTGHGLTHVGARHISYQGAMFDLKGSTADIRITCTRNPDNKTFYFSDGRSANGAFDLTVPLLRDGSASFGLVPQGVAPAKIVVY